MTGYESKRAAARDRMMDDDDTQVYQNLFPDAKNMVAQPPIQYSFKAYWAKDGRIGVVGCIIRPDGGPHIVEEFIDPPQPKQEPLSKLQEPTAERAWFTIAELNAWADKKLSENPHWVMPKDEPERDEPSPQRPWVGLTEEEIAEFGTWHDNREEEVGWVSPAEIVAYINAKLKEKNDG
jgi:hypothetical protein